MSKQMFFEQDTTGIKLEQDHSSFKKTIGLKIWFIGLNDITQ